jgi:SAM-dependent methyltransferase
MFEFHTDKERYFKMQKEVTQAYVIPFLESHVNLNPEFKVLEIGCGEAGVLQAFTDLGIEATGIELYESRVENARKFMHEEYSGGKVSFIVKNIYDIDVQKDLKHKFDLVILKDVIEHIPDQEKFISIIHSFLNPGGKIFFAFPPWQMPFGGHQQICKSKVLSRLPYFHLLPMFLYIAILKLFGESERCIQELREIKSTGISIERFEQIIGRSSFRILKRRFYLFNPIYKYKLGVNPREQFGIVASIPYLRNFFTMGVYYIVG